MSENRYVFISYSSIDAEYVSEIASVLEDYGIDYWKAPENIPAGSNYAKEIPKAIKDCALFLLVCSKNSQESIWVEKELDTAICHRKEILPVQIDSFEMNDLFKFYLNNVQMFPLVYKEQKINNSKDFVDKVKDLSGLFRGSDSDIERKMELFISDEQAKRTDKRSNALRMNRIPLDCEYCGNKVKLKSIGVYVCEKCGKENYDDFYKVRAYIEKYGPAPAIVISRKTGVPRASIEFFKNS